MANQKSKTILELAITKKRKERMRVQLVGGMYSVQSYNEAMKQ